MPDLKLIGNIFGWAGSVLSVYFFSAPVIPFFKLIRGQIKVGDSPGLLLIFSVFNCILWFNYGLLLGRPQMWVTNAIGCGLTLIFVTIFLTYFTKVKIYLTALMLFGLTVIIGALTYLCYFVIYYSYVGYSANVFNVLMYASTGEKLYRVFKTKNYNLMPIFSIVGSFFNASCWLIYAIFDFEINVLIPNGLGFVLSGVQLVVYFYFYCQKRKNDKVLDGEGGNYDKLI